MQSHASTSVRTLNFPNANCHIPVFGHTKILHTLIATGSAALAAVARYSGKATRISRKGQSKIVNTICKKKKKKKKNLWDNEVLIFFLIKNENKTKSPQCTLSPPYLLLLMFRSLKGLS